MRLDQVNICQCPTRQGARLIDSLAHLLADMGHRTIGTDDDERQVAMTGLGNRRSQIKQRRSRSHTHGDGLSQLLGHAQGKKSRTALVSHGIAIHRRALVEVVHDGRVA